MGENFQSSAGKNLTIGIVDLDEDFLDAFLGQIPIIDRKSQLGLALHLHMFTGHAQLNFSIGNQLRFLCQAGDFVFIDIVVKFVLRQLDAEVYEEHLVKIHKNRGIQKFLGSVLWALEGILEWALQTLPLAHKTLCFALRGVQMW